MKEKWGVSLIYTYVENTNLPFSQITGLPKYPQKVKIVISTDI